MKRDTRALFERQLHFSIRKLSVGVCSLAIGASLMGMGQVVAADTITPSTDATSEQLDKTDVPETSQPEVTSDKQTSPEEGKPAPAATQTIPGTSEKVTNVDQNLKTDETNTVTTSADQSSETDAAKEEKLDTTTNVDSTSTVEPATSSQAAETSERSSITMTPRSAAAEDRAASNDTAVTRLELTPELAEKIKKGLIGFEGNRYDGLLLNSDVLQPDGDEDGDKLTSKSEIYIYEKNGRKYIGIDSHPLLEDTDGDGIPDGEEKPGERLIWNVSDRDLAMFQELSYRDDDYINQVLDNTKDITPYQGRKEYYMMNKELAPYWKVKKTYHESNGFDAVLFETKSDFPYLPDGSAQVLAIRGTSGSGDVSADGAIFLGREPSQAVSVENLIKLYASGVENLTNLYITGHSLGGYLTQIAVAQAYQLVKEKKGSTPQEQEQYNHFYNDVLKKATTFNAPRVRTNKLQNWDFWNKGLYSTQLAKEGKITNYVVDNDSVVGGMLNDSDARISIGRSAGGHSSRSYFEGRVNELPYFKVGKRDTMDGTGYRDPKVSEAKLEGPKDGTLANTFKPALLDGNPVTVLAKESLTDEQVLAKLDRDNLPENVRFTVTKPATSQIGQAQAQVLVTYLDDNSTASVTVPVTVEPNFKELDAVYSRGQELAQEKVDISHSTFATARAYISAKKSLETALESNANFKESFNPDKQTQADIDAVTDELTKRVTDYIEKKNGLQPDTERTIELRILLDSDGDLATPEAHPTVFTTLPDVSYTDDRLTTYLPILAEASEEDPDLKDLLILSRGALTPVYQEGLEGYTVALEIWASRLGKVYNAAEKTATAYQVTWQGDAPTVSYTLSKPATGYLTKDGKPLADTDYGTHVLTGKARFENLVFNAVTETSEDLPLTYQADSDKDYGDDRRVEGCPQVRQTTATMDPKTGQVTTHTETTDPGQAPVLIKGTKTKVTETAGALTTVYRGDDSQARDYRNEVAGIAPVTKVTTRYTLDTQTGNITTSETREEVAGQPTVITLGTAPKVERQSLPAPKVYEADPSLTYGDKAETAGTDGEILTKTSYQVNEQTGQVTESVTTSRTEATATVVRVGNREVTTQVIPLTTRYVEDANLEAGQEVVVQAGKEGQEELIRTYKVNAQDGSLSEPSLVRETKVTMEERLIRFGSKSPAAPSEEALPTAPITTSTSEEDIPYKQVIEEDATLAKGQQYIRVAGHNGKRTLTTYKTVVDGQVVAETTKVTSETPAVDEVLVVGTKEISQVPTDAPSEENLPEAPIETSTTEEVIPYKRVIEEDANLAKGQQYIRVTGQNGKRQLTTYKTVVDGQVVAETTKVTAETPAVDEILVVGTKDISQVPTDAPSEEALPEVPITTTTSEETIPYKQVIEEDGSLAKGRQYVRVTGQNGKRELTTYKTVVNGEVVAEITKVTSETPAVDEVLVVGIKEVSQVPTDAPSEDKLPAAPITTTTTEEDIPYKQVVEEDATLAKGQQYVRVAGQNGKRELTTYKTVVDGQVVAETTKVTAETPAVDEVLVVGTKEVSQIPTDAPSEGKLPEAPITTTTSEEVLPYKQVIEEDATLAKGQQYVRVAGQNGKRKLTTYKTIVDGEVVAETTKVTTETPAVDEVLVVGTKDISQVPTDAPSEEKLPEAPITTSTTEEDIPYKQVIEEDATLAKGQQYIRVAGHNGKRTLTTYKTVVDGQVVAETTKVTSETPAVDEVLVVGTKEISQVPTDAPSEENLPAAPIETNTTEEAIPYKQVIEEDASLEKGQQYVRVAGQNGKRTLTTYKTVVDGQVVAETTKVTSETPAVDEVLVVGTKEVSQVPDTAPSEETLPTAPIEISTTEEEIPYKQVVEEDVTLEKGQQHIRVNGQNGKRQVTTYKTIVDGEVVAETTKVTAEIPAVDEVLVVGTKEVSQVPTDAPSEETLPTAPITTSTTEEELPYKQVIEEDSSLAKGQQYIRVTGQNGKRELTTYKTVVDGEVVAETTKVTAETPAVDEVLVVGTKEVSQVPNEAPSEETLPEAPITTSTSEEEIPYKQVIEEDTTLEKGQQYIRVAGQNGKRTLTTYKTIVDGQVVAETTKVTSETPAVDEVLVVGTKEISQVPTDAPSEEKLPEAPITTTTSEEEVPYKQVIEEDSSLAKGQQYIRVEGQNGKRQVTIYKTVVDGQVVAETTKVTAETPAVDEVLVVGTKEVSQVPGTAPSEETLPSAPITTITTEEVIPYKQVIEEDATLAKGRQYVRVSGQNGKRSITTYKTVVDGQVVAETTKVTSETPAVDEVLVVGTKEVSQVPDTAPSEEILPTAPITTTTSEEVIPYKQVIEEDNSLAKGQQHIRVTGQNGKRELTTYNTVVDGQVVAETTKVTVETPAVDEILVVGTKEVSQVSDTAPIEESLPTAPITTTTREEVIPYKQVVEEDSSLAKGQEYIRVAGHNGKRELTTYKTIEDGQVVAETTKVTAETSAVDEVLVVGTKEVSQVSDTAPIEESLPTAPIETSTTEEEIPYKQVVEEDSTLAKGQEYIRVTGQNGKRTLTTYKTIVDGQVVAETTKVTAETPAVDEVLVVGTKAPELSPLTPSSDKNGQGVQKCLTPAAPITELSIEDKTEKTVSQTPGNKAKSAEKTLPNTGDQSANLATGLGLMTLVSALALARPKKKS